MMSSPQHMLLGNPLVLVHVPNYLKNALSQTQKQTIAREFNLSETVFIHEGNPNADKYSLLTFRRTSFHWEWMVPSFPAPSK